MRTLVILCALGLPASAEVRTYVLAVGNNAAPADTDGETLASLQFADDDAAAFVAYARGFSRATLLLTVLDGPSARRFPDQAAMARPPTLVELKKAVTALRARFEADEREGHDPVLLLFFSGHGTRGGDRPASLALLDGPLTREVLYRDVLAALPARYIHLFVDACHAEAIVRPRDLDAERVPVSSDDVRDWATSATLERFANVGAVLATTAGAQAHEWEAYQHGVFSYELLSALRGAADVNGDGKIEYSELSAYLGAANREVADPRAHLSVVVRPPPVNRRTPLVDLTTVHGDLELSGRPAALGRITIEDERGERLADVNAEPGLQVTLLLPAGRRLFLRHGGVEATLAAAKGAHVDFAQLRFAPASLNARGSVEESLHHGLFATAFGPRYYRGYVDQNTEVTPVPLQEDAPPAVPRPPPARPRSRTPSAALFATGAAAGVASLILGGLAASAAASFERTDLERPAQSAHDRAVPLIGASAAALAVAVISTGLGVWLRPHTRSHAQAWLSTMSLTW